MRESIKNIDTKIEELQTQIDSLQTQKKALQGLNPAARLTLFLFDNLGSAHASIRESWPYEIKDGVHDWTQPAHKELYYRCQSLTLLLDDVVKQGLTEQSGEKIITALFGRK